MEHFDVVVVTGYTETKIEGRTVTQVSRTIQRSTAETAELLAELQRDGIAQEIDGLWRLTDEAEARFGQALRDLSGLTI